MLPNCLYTILRTLAVMVLLSSCRTLEKASTHGLTSGFYKWDGGPTPERVYAEVTADAVEIHQVTNGQPAPAPLTNLPLEATDSLMTRPVSFRKQSLDIDITAVPLKFRPAVYGLPHQLTTDVNVALYAGWRFDRYTLDSRTDALGKRHHRISQLGYDFGVFAGPGATPINAATTNNRTNSEYSGMIMQTGVAGFLESNVASFGLAVGFDHLMNRDRGIWIFNRQPWVGFIVGIALN